jgi:isoprenylcysteine carboxyl methyltransferase (ICMT) family protein YpbQ
MYWLRWFFPQEKTIHLVLIGLIVSVAPLWLYDLLGLKVYERPSTGLTKPGEMNFQRLILKLIGLYFTYFVILIFYKLNSFYYVSAKAIDFYGNFFSVLYEWGPFFILISAFYFWIVDRRQKNPYDEYWQMGCFLTGRFKEVKGVVLKEYVKGWFIKAFFIPLMFGLLVIYVDIVLQARWDGASFVPLYNQFLDVFYAVDILFGVLGYVLALRLLDTHIQSTEPTVLGWFVCLACYSPFYSIFGIGLLPSTSDMTWDTWLSSNPMLFYFCGVSIVILSAIYALATVAIGYRMSNLTYRGLITSGPYRFTKHPAYVCKVISWWLVSLPFLSTEGPLAASIQSFSMLVITVIYYLRAKTEENHLSNYPEYVQYAEWINDHGIFSFFGKTFPNLRYSQEKAKKYNSVVWFKKMQK